MKFDNNKAKAEALSAERPLALSLPFYWQKAKKTF
jgi:hypothetical protein